MALGTPILMLLLAVLGIAVGVFLLVFLIVPIFKGIGWLIRHVFQFVFGMILDVLRLVGSIVTAIVMIPLILGNVLVGRWSASAHYGRSLQSEIVSGGLSVYRCLIGHPAKFLLLSALTEGLEKRLPAAVAAAPTSDRPAGSGRAQQFDGYTIVGSLQAGGSGGKLYVANPEPGKRAAFERAGHRDVQQVVIKTFSLEDGSELPQIVRESRSLDAAKKLGLVLDHELSNSRFYYAMRYVPGQPLGLVTPQLHAASDGSGLDERHLRLGMGYIADLLETLESYHRGGLWHKDVKPDNIIVAERAHLVDFGLVTPLRSSMTLTTHGTEYFRDPELVRLALKGVKVSEVDGARFDVFAVGAVLYSIIENSFPAHGVLSQVSRRCPEALKWVIRRAMADYDKRYPSAAAMLLDLKCVQAAVDPFAVKPIDLPSMQGQVPASPRPFDDAAFRQAYVTMPPMGGSPEMGGNAGFAGVGAGGFGAGGFAGAGAQGPAGRGAGSPAGVGAGAGRSKLGAAKISVKNWWTGEFTIKQDGGAGVNVGAGAAGVGAAGFGGAGPFVGAAAYSPVPPVGAGAGAGTPAGFAPVPPPLPRRSAAEQLTAARSRAAARRERASTRMANRMSSRGGAKPFSSEPNAGVFMALFFFLGVCVLVVGAIVAVSLRQNARQNQQGAATYSNSDFEGGWATMTLPVPSVPVVPAPPTVVNANGTDVEVSNAGQDAGSLADEEGDSEGTVFVWVDLQRPLSAAHEAAIRAATGSLKEMGFTIVGEAPGIEIAAADRETVVQETAELVATTSALPWESEPARLVMAEWAKSKQDVDLVLRFHGQPAGAGGGSDIAAQEIGLSLVTRRSEDADERERLLGLFSTAQRVLQRGRLE